MIAPDDQTGAEGADHEPAGDGTVSHDLLDLLHIRLSNSHNDHPY
jgi:hypothetical protein